MVCSNCGVDEKYAKGLCQKCYNKKRMEDDPERIKNMIKKSQQKYHQKKYDENPSMKKESLERFRRSQVCKIIKKHHNDMKDDPESLSTEFMQEMIGVNCND